MAACLDCGWTVVNPARWANACACYVKPLRGAGPQWQQVYGEGGIGRFGNGLGDVGGTDPIRYLKNAA